MAVKTFKTWLTGREFKKSLKEKSPFTDAVGALGEVVTGIQEAVPERDILVTLEPSGLVVNAGQQYRVVIGTKDGKFSVPLFRAYVATDGSKVSFDFYDDEMTIAKGTRDDIFDAVSQFLVRPTTIAQFQQLADYLRRKPAKK